MITQRLLLSFLICLLMTGCVVQAPKYTKVEKVLLIEPGMTKEEVIETLGIPPYDLKSKDSSGYVIIYKYRVTDRNTIPLLMGPTNGVKAKGKWVDLFITFSNDDRVLSLESCSDCEETRIKEKRIDFGALLTLITITLPAVLVILKIQ